MDQDTAKKNVMIAAGAGIVVFLLAWLLFAGFLGAALLGLIVFGVLLVVLGFRSERSAAESAQPAKRVESSTAASDPGAAAASAATGAQGGAVAAEGAAAAEATSTTDDPVTPPPADSMSAPETPAPAPAADPAPEAPGAPTAPEGQKWKPSASLPGQQELAGRKGSWRYEGQSGTAATAPREQAGTQAAAEASPAPAEGPGEKPATLDAPREGGKDDLKRIRGVGPKLEDMLNDMGFYHFDQIAAWGPQEVAWVDQNLQGFKGRVSRDGWVAQARTLAEGGETEFSQKVDDGDVY